MAHSPSPSEPPSEDVTLSSDKTAATRIAEQIQVAARLPIKHNLTSTVNTVDPAPILAYASTSRKAPPTTTAVVENLRR